MSTDEVLFSRCVHAEPRWPSVGLKIYSEIDLNGLIDPSNTMSLNCKSPRVALRWIGSK